ncbi:MAG: transposase [Mariprofundus sp.]
MSSEALFGILSSMNKEEEIRDKASENAVERLIWRTSKKDQADITQKLADGAEIPEVYNLGEAGIFDEFFHFLYSFGIEPLLQMLNPGKNKRDSHIDFHSVILIYIMRIVCGLRFFSHTKILLQSQSLMQLAGFNGRKVRYGSTQRGVRKKEASDAEEAESGDRIRGPIDVGSIASWIERISASRLERFFNSVISILAKNRFFPKKIHAVLDASEIESTEQCIGRGKVKKEKAPELRLRKARIKKTVVIVFGFKIWVVWEPKRKLPLAMRFAPIQTHDIKMAQAVVEQAIKNVAPYAKITSLAIDRGFTDGKFLWWLDQNGVIFYIPAKENMQVYADAISLVSSGIEQQRIKKYYVGRGKNRQEKEVLYRAVGINALTSAGWYGELGSGSHENAKSFKPNPINAVVVLDSHYKKENDDDLLVILTNGAVDKPLATYDAYDRRSEIENSLFREAKQAWFIERPARNSDKAFRAHAYLTITMMALTHVFRIWIEEQDNKELAGENTGIRKYREQIRKENANKLIVFDGDQYAIFEVYELFILAGRNVLRPRGVEEVITKEDILRKYGAILE